MKQTQELATPNNTTKLFAFERCLV